MIFVILLLLFSFNNTFKHVNCSDEEEKLIKNLFKGYNKLIRPVRNSSDHVNITMDLVLLQLINVYEKEQIMKTNVWVNLKWTDFQLLWSRQDYNIVSIRMPFDRVWTPDIVLFNNADGNYEASFKSNVVIYSGVSGGQNILWVPPSIYKSSCTIDVTYFPFDEQWCEMRFGSWTFDANQVRLIREKPTASFGDYLPSGTWDVIEAPTEEYEYIVDGTKRMELVYKFRIRRKTLFYTVNLIIPTVLISFLSIFVFYLPTDEGEKMTLCISILLALVVFLLLVSKILPPTSIVIPLIAKYLLFTLIMNIVTILNTVIIINWNYRTPRTHNMPRWVRVIFTEILPKILFMQRRINTDKSEFDIDYNYSIPTNSNNNNNKIINSLKMINITDTSDEDYGAINKINSRAIKKTATTVLSTPPTPTSKYHQHQKPNNDDTINKTTTTPRTHRKQQQHLNLTNHITKKKTQNNNNNINNDANTLITGDIIINNNYVYSNNINSNNNNSMKRSTPKLNKIDKYQRKSYSFDNDQLDEKISDSNEEYSQDVLDAADKVAYITNHIKSENDYQEVRDDWKYVALVIDRLQLYIFFSVTVIGTVCILLRAPHIFEFVDQSEILKRMRENNNPFNTP